MGEIRAISSGLGVPQLETWTLTETVSRVVSTHERRTRTKVTVTCDCAQEQVTEETDCKAGLVQRVRGRWRLGKPGAVPFHCGGLLGFRGNHGE